MADAIEPGMWVERWRPYSGPQDTVVGQIYRVEEVGPVWDCMACDSRCGGIRLAGVKCTSPGGWNSSCCFRPIYRPRADLIESLKAPSPSRELEDA